MTELNWLAARVFDALTVFGAIIFLVVLVAGGVAVVSACLAPWRRHREEPRTVTTRDGFEHTHFTDQYGLPHYRRRRPIPPTSWRRLDELIGTNIVDEDRP